MFLATSLKVGSWWTSTLIIRDNMLCRASSQNRLNFVKLDPVTGKVTETSVRGPFFCVLVHYYAECNKERKDGIFKILERLRHWSDDWLVPSDLTLCVCIGIKRSCVKIPSLYICAVFIEIAPRRLPMLHLLRISTF